MCWSDPYSYDADPDLYLNWAVLRKDEFLLFFNYFFLLLLRKRQESSRAVMRRGKSCLIVCTVGPFKEVLCCCMVPVPT